MTKIFGAEFRRVDDREHLGKRAVVAVAARTYDTSVEDLWHAITTPARLARWFTPVAGDLRFGGRYQLTGNASGTITRCDPPEALDLTWEFGGGTSWVTVRLAAVGARARFTLEHIAHRDGIGAEHLAKYGPGAVGVGWELSLLGLAQHLADPVALVNQEGEAWLLTDEGKQLVRVCGEAWGVAHAASGADPDEARASAERTIAFYTGA